MATRFYLTNSPSTYNPALVRGAWDANGGILFGKKLSTTKEGTQSSNGANEASGTNNWDVSLYQFVSEPLLANATLSGTADYVLGILGATSLNARTHIHVWVTQGPTTAARGTLIANNVDTVNWATSPTSLAKSAIALTSVNALRGDRIVVEVGYRAVNTSTANLGPGVVYTSGTAGDLAAGDNPVSTAKSPWIEFSFDIPVLTQPYTFQVSAAADDARNIDGNGTFNNTVVTQHLGKFDTVNKYWNGWRWLGVTIPQGVTIVNAYVTLFSAAVFGGTTAKTRWFGNKVASATTFANTTADKPEGKTRTTAVVNKDFTVANWQSVGFNTSDTIDVTTLVQEIVNQAGWVSGGNMAIIAGDNGSSNTNYIGHSTYNSDPSRGAKLTVEFLTGDEPDIPSNFVASESAGNVVLTWDDNSLDEDNFEIQKKRGNSPNWYTLTEPAANVETYTDTDVDSGYTYYYRIRASNTAGSSLWVESNSITMSGTKAWTAKIGAWVYPGSPAQNADEEYSDGRVIHKLKPEYYTVNSSGALVQLVDPADGENAYNATNAADVINNSEEQYFTISANAANTAALVNNATNVTNAINTIVSFVQTIGFTGVELDWEGYSSWSSTTYTNYKTFVDSLGTALHAVSKKLIIDGPPITNATEQGFYQWHYEDFNSLTIDYIVMMLYDYQYDFGAGQSVQPTGWMRNGCQWMRNKVTDVNKIVIGMPSYGYHGTTGGFTITIDTKAQSALRTGYGTATRNSDDEMTWVNAGVSNVYQDTTGLNAKRERIEDEGIKNISVWHLGGNDWFSGKQEILVDDGRMLAYQDSFNRANADDIGSTDGAGFADPYDYNDGSDDTLFEISSNKLVSHDNNSGVFYDVPVPNILVEADLEPPTSGMIGMMGRLNFGSGNGYAVLATDNGTGHFSLSLYTITGFGPDTSLWDSVGTYASGSKVSLKIVGTTLAVYVEDVNESGNITNSHATDPGNAGFFADTGGAIDNVSVYIYNNAPVANDQSVNVPQNTATDITLTGSDDDGDQLTYVIDTYPAHGDLSTGDRLISSDSFNRANGSLGSTDGSGLADPATWSFSPGTTYAITSNRAECTNDGGGGGVAVLSYTHTNVDISAKVWPASGGISGVGGRLLNGQASGYYAYANETDGTVYLAKSLGPGSTVLDNTASGVFSPGDTLRITIIGNSINVYVNGVLEIGPVTDNTWTGPGDVIFLTSQTGGQFDDFSATEVSQAINVDDILTNPTLVYTPDNDYVGPDSFDFYVNDGLENSAPATISITVIQNEYNISDSITVSDSLSSVLSFPLFLGDSISVTDSAQKSSTHPLSDSVTMEDDPESGILVIYVRQFNESVTVSDSSGSAIVQLIEETVTVSDAQSKVIHKLSTDSITTSDNQTSAPHKNLADSVTASDSQGTVNNFTRTFNDSVTVSESAAKSVIKPFTDSVTASDLVTEVLLILKSISDSVNVTDQRVSSSIKLITNSVSVSDGETKVIVKTITDSVTVTDNTTPSVSTKLLTDSVTVSDAETKIITKTHSESVEIIDNFNYVVVFPVFVSDEITFTDNESKTIVKTLTDSVTVSDNKTQVIVLTLTETVTVSDNAAKSVTKPLSDSVNVTDNTVQRTTIILSDSVTVSDSFSSVGSMSWSISDSVTLSDDTSITVNSQPLDWYVPDPHTWYEDAPTTWYN